VFLIFQSIGTQELILIGIVALIFLGPRKLPEYARKIGKMMYAMRSTANEFKTTWEREIDLEEEIKALDIGKLEAEAEQPVSRSRSEPIAMKERSIRPSVREVDPSEVDDWREGLGEAEPLNTSEPEEDFYPSEFDKRSWL
jgi:sec-independent protein translocase protein TatB